ncbi:hypothetical protein E1212_19185 [Jiangella ureilytica]|uniref:Uncharacterized protein n=1 Tax=Jiangella ureilytica TaxID=2530374 RepID=A0A4R4RJF7_9ACTN|nr:hypothetical protein [Jiangella ureilytica]TDC49099.1 hypothetical protein E1212_19185 [Jiangella ureilytica]
MAEQDDAEHDLGAYERRFRRSGLPLFIEDYTASEDIFTRAAPLLALVFLGEMLAATELEWPLLLNLVAALGGMAILIVAFGLLNRARGRRFLELPNDVGWPELAAFVLVPALLPVIFGGQWRQFLAIAAGNTLLLLLIYLVVGFGFIATVFWALSRMADELAASLGRLVRTLPLLLIFSLVLFVNAEMWEMFGTMPRPFVLVVTGLLFGLGLVFLIVRAPGLVHQLEAELNQGTPALTRRQRLNVGLTLVVSQVLQVFVVSVGVGAFFVAFGLFALSPEVGVGWAGTAGDWAYGFDLWGHPLQLTETLLRVAGGMAAITGLYYAISILTDSTYRDEFMAGVTHEMRGVFEARAQYLALRG